jgi:hypothetical protein
MNIAGVAVEWRSGKGLGRMTPQPPAVASLEAS